MENEELYEQAMDAITDLFDDTNVTDKVTVGNLECLINEINDMIESLKVKGE